MGGTRLLIDADGIANVPVESNGAPVYTNMFGKAVVADINNYYRNQAYIDLNNLPEDAEATQSVVQATLTEGAIGYRKFKVISGQKAMAVLRSAQCEIVLPKPLPADLFSGLLLPCEQKGTAAPDSSAPEIKPVIQDQTRQVTPTEAPTSISATQ